MLHRGGAPGFSAPSLARQRFADKADRPPASISPPEIQPICRPARRRGMSGRGSSDWGRTGGVLSLSGAIPLLVVGPFNGPRAVRGGLVMIEGQHGRGVRRPPSSHYRRGASVPEVIARDGLMNRVRRRTTEGGGARSPHRGDFSFPCFSRRHLLSGSRRPPAFTVRGSMGGRNNLDVIVAEDRPSRRSPGTARCPKASTNHQTAAAQATRILRPPFALRAGPAPQGS